MMVVWGIQRRLQVLLQGVQEGENEDFRRLMEQAGQPWPLTFAVTIHSQKTRTIFFK